MDPHEDEPSHSYVCVFQLQCEDGDIQLLATSKNKENFQSLKTTTNFFSSIKEVRCVLPDILSAVYNALYTNTESENHREKDTEIPENSQSQEDSEEISPMEKVVKKRKRYKERVTDITMCDVPSVTQVTNTPYKCSLCKESFSHRRSSFLHRANKHADVPLNLRIFQCNICEKTFTTAGILHQHLPVHASVKSYRCSGHCDKTFTTKYLWKNHEQTYIHEMKPHLCGICGKAWPTKGALKGHMVTHDRERVHQCTQCGKAYLRKSDLTEHLFTHKGRQFPCPLCGTLFMRRSDIRKHMPIHETNRSRPFACTVCAKAFHKKHLMEMHKLRHFKSKSLITDVFKDSVPLTVN